jgi:gliding motility-associated lipoprotein GldD
MRLLKFWFLGFVILLQACNSEAPRPRPRCYPKVIYPERGFKKFDVNLCSFTFEQPIYMEYKQDTSFFGGKPANDCWFNLHVPIWNADIHFTYHPIKGKDDVYNAFNDAFKLASQHDKKADSNEDYAFSNQANKVYGVLYDIQGFVASPFQFTVTDSLHHTVHAALYFNARPDPDSLAPMVEFVKADMMHLLNTMSWTKS